MPTRGAMYRPLGWILLTLFVFGVLIILVLDRRDQIEVPPPLESLGYYQLETPVVLNDVELVDAAGTAALNVLRGRWSMLFFGFTRCPDVCPTTLSVMNLALADVAQPPRVVLISVDPGDDLQAVQTYARAFNPDFLALGGSPDKVQSLADLFGIAYVKVPGEGADYSMEHSALLVVLDPDGRHVGYVRPPLHPETLRQIVAAVMIQR